MNGPALFEESQSFSPWLYALVGFVLAILLAVLTARQTTTVTPGAVTVRFGFLYRTSIPLSEVRQAEAIAYRPIAEYGGWGIRGFGKRRALNTGATGRLITRTDGSTIRSGRRSRASCSVP
jgi:hypothetical protein